MQQVDKLSSISAPVVACSLLFRSSTPVGGCALRAKRMEDFLGAICRIEGIKIKYGIAAEFAMYGAIGCDDREARSHCFDQRLSERFRIGGKDKQIGVAIQPDQFFVGEISTAFDDLAETQGFGTLEKGVVLWFVARFFAGKGGQPFDLVACTQDRWKGL